MDTGAFWKSFAASQSIVGTDTTDLPGGGGSSIRDVGVDAAGNVLIVNSSFEAFRIYSPPDGANSFNTFSPWAIDVDNSTVIPTPVDFSTSVDESISNVPERFSLAQNYPNPFNPSTIIKYSVPENGFVRLSVYNLVGEEVSVLVSETVDAGFYEVTFNATNLPSGTYFYRLQVGNIVQLKKMLLMK